MRVDARANVKASWSNGFLRQIRYNEFDCDLCRILIGAINSLPRLSDDDFDKELTYLIWFIPLYTEQHIQRFKENGIECDLNLVNELKDAVYRCFDNPSR